MFHELRPVHTLILLSLTLCSCATSSVEEVTHASDDKVLSQKQVSKERWRISIGRDKVPVLYIPSSEVPWANIPLFQAKCRQELASKSGTDSGWGVLELMVWLQNSGNVNFQLKSEVIIVGTAHGWLLTEDGGFVPAHWNTVKSVESTDPYSGSVTFGERKFEGTFSEPAQIRFYQQGEFSLVSSIGRDHMYDGRIILAHQFVPPRELGSLGPVQLWYGLAGGSWRGQDRTIFDGGPERRFVGFPDVMRYKGGPDKQWERAPRVDPDLFGFLGGSD